MCFSWRRLLLPALCLLAPLLVASDSAALTKEQIKQFLLTAQVVKSKHTGKGTTSPWRLTLSDGTLTHDAHFQTVDERKSEMKLPDGTTEMNFVDSYKYDIAAYALAELLGLDDVVPVTVERTWNGENGALSWWEPVMMDEGERLKRKVPTPDPDDWNQQMYRIRVLNQLVYDTDVNLTNVLIGYDWKLWRIDFSRAFRLKEELQSPKDLARCDRNLLEKLKALDEKQLAERTKGYLTGLEVHAVMVRRAKIVDHFQKLIAEKGEKEVLY